MSKRFSFLVFFCAALPVFAGEKPPEWTRGAVWYQILPERFRNINPYNDPVKENVAAGKDRDWQAHPWASDWYKMQVWEQDSDVPVTELLQERRFGGDLIGVVEKLPYLKALGVDAIYLTPVFESPSVEKYDAETWHHIDNNFGLEPKEDLKIIRKETEDRESWTLTKADEAFVELIAQAHELGMKVVIEGVFSYSSNQFWAFRDLAENQQDSKYKAWYEVVTWDDPVTPDTVEFDYKCWQGDKSRPLFKTDEKGFLSEPVQKYLFDATARWLDPNGDGDPLDGVDGWSVTQVGGLHSGFWKMWTKHVKSLNPDAVTISDEPYLKSEFDLWLSHEQKNLMLEFFVNNHHGLSATDFSNKLSELRSRQGEDESLGLLTLVSSPREDRLASVIVNSQPPLADVTSANNRHFAYNPVRPDSTQRKVQRLVTLFQLTYPGAPMIFYGDESGMWGGNYPDNIKPMLWKEFVYERETYRSIRPDLVQVTENTLDQRLLDLYRRLNLTRRKNLALRIGSYDEIIVDDANKVFAFARKYYQNEVLVFMNLSNQKQSIEYNPGWKKNLKVRDPFSLKKFRLDKFEIKLELEPVSGRVLVKEK